jgi:hypothetical protein
VDAGAAHVPVADHQGHVGRLQFLADLVHQAHDAVADLGRAVGYVVYSVMPNMVKHGPERDLALQLAGGVHERGPDRLALAEVRAIPAAAPLCRGRWK